MTMQQKITRDTLRYAVGRQMFCPTCKRVLYVRRAVELDFYRAGELAGVKVVCASCYDAKCGNGKLEREQLYIGKRVPCATCGINPAQQS